MVQFAIREVSQIYTITQHQIMLEVFLIGSLSIMGLYHFSLYFFRKKSLEALYFGALCLCIAIRVSVTGERIFTELHLPWEWLIKMEYLSFYVAVPLFCLYIKSLFQEEFSKRGDSNRFLVRYSFLSKSNFHASKNFHQIHYRLSDRTGHIMSVYHYGYHQSLAEKTRRSDLFSIGFLFLFMTTINDILYSQMIINTGDFSAIGLLVFIFSNP